MGVPFGRELRNSHSGLSGAPAHCAVKPPIQLFQARQIAQAIRQALVACDERVKAGKGCVSNVNAICFDHAPMVDFFGLKGIVK